MNSQPATSGSASCQTHLSTTNSQQRLRATNSYAAQPTKQPAALSTTVLSNPNTLATALRTFFPLDQLQDHPLPRSWKGLASRWIALVYCFLSLIFLSIALYKHICLGNTFRNPVHNIPVTSTLEFLSAEQRLSRPYPGLKMFDPYLLPGARSTNDRAITACLWTTDAEDNFPAIVAWASGWKGPISLVMATTQVPRSAPHQQLISRLRNLQMQPSSSGLSLHLVHTMNEQYLSHAAYLNLARLFAVSPTVMLFPANLSSVLPSSFYAALASHHPIRKPVLVTSAMSTSAFSIPQLTPVVLPRHYRSWCSERTVLPSRVSEWDDCLWQLWLEENGLGQVNITVKLDSEELDGPAAVSLSCQDGILSQQLQDTAPQSLEW